jgi:hypothetical protein
MPPNGPIENKFFPYQANSLMQLTLQNLTILGQAISQIISGCPKATVSYNTAEPHVAL